MTTTTILDPARLYLGDNGRCFCGSLRCAGSSAFHSGREISGQEVYPLTEMDFVQAKRDGYPLSCETCGKGAF